jgi:Putative prokaryotic signal transducing protein
MSVKGWTVVYRGNRFQAEIIAAALQANGLTPEVFGDNAYGVLVDFGAARLMVPDGQASSARRLIKEAEEAPPEPEAETESEEDV